MIVPWALILLFGRYLVCWSERSRD